MKRYGDSEQGQENQKKSMKRYRESQQGHATHKESMKRYCDLEYGQATQKDSIKRYRDSEHGKVIQKQSIKNYFQATKGHEKLQEAKNCYRTSDKAIANRKCHNLCINFKKNIQRFKTNIKNGPFYICVICNRSLYKRSVRFFTDSIYAEISSEYFLSRIQSFAGNEYICETCHPKFLPSCLE